MKKIQVCYTLTELAGGYLARCVTNPVATAYGETEDEAGDNLVDAIRTYVRLYPDRAKEVTQSPLTKELVLDDADGPPLGTAPRTLPGR